ncbi:MAG: hypothetical protein IPN80_02850 [Flavobacterium sp.]|nr:hypothetical protein [Flavobacterium sp.]
MPIESWLLAVALGTLALAPKVVLFEPVVIRLPEEYPTAVLFCPAEFCCSACHQAPGVIDAIKIEFYT